MASLTKSLKNISFWSKGVTFLLFCSLPMDWWLYSWLRETNLLFAGLSIYWLYLALFLTVFIWWVAYDDVEVGALSGKGSALKDKLINKLIADYRFPIVVAILGAGIEILRSPNVAGIIQGGIIALALYSAMNGLRSKSQEDRRPVLVSEALLIVGPVAARAFSWGTILLALQGDNDYLVFIGMVLSFFMLLSLDFGRERGVFGR